MQNSKTIPAGATVYYCRRGLDYRYTMLMEIKSGIVKKRTPLGYKLEDRYTEGRRLDVDYYISEDRKEVVAAVLKDISAATDALYNFIGELEKAADKL